MNSLIRQVLLLLTTILVVSSTIATFVYQKEKIQTAQKNTLPSSDPHWSVFYSEVGNALPVASQEPIVKNQNAIKRNRSQYTLEVKVFKTRGEANAFIEQLSKQRVDTYFTPFQMQDGRVQYRVRAGLFPSLASAERVSHELKNKRIDNQIVKLN